MRGTVIILLVTGCAAFAASGCRAKGPPAPPAARQVTPGAPLEVVAGGEYVFTYLDGDGRFRSVGTLDEVPAAARAVVRVVDPARPPEQRTDTERVWVADLSQPPANGRYSTKLVDRDVFESAAFGQLPPGDGSKFAVPGAAPSPGGPPVAAAPPAGGPPAGAAPPPAGAVPPPGPPALGQPAPGQPAPVARNRDRIILYGTAWCGACAKARAWLKAKGVAFDDKDPERDPAAAAELVAKAQRAGIKPDRVPIIDVRGTILQGFDPKRLEALLGVQI